MVRGSLPLAVLLVALLLVGYVPVTGYAAGTVDGDARNEPITSGTDAVLDTADTVSSTADGDGDDEVTVSNVSEEIGDDVNDTVNHTEDETDDTADEAEDAVNDTANEAEDAKDEAEDAEDAVNDTADETEDAEDEAEDATEAVEEDVDDTTDEVGDGVGDTADGVDATNTTELTDDTVDTAESVIDGVERTANTLDHTELGAVLPVEAQVDTVAAVDSASVDVDTAAGVNGTAVTSVNKAPESVEERLQSMDSAATTGAEELTDTGETTDSASETGTDRADGADRESGVPMPDRTTGTGIAVGVVLVGAGLIVRNAGTAAAVSALGGSGGSLLATLVSVLKDWVGRLLGIFGYKRYSDDNPLEHGTRERLYEFIRDSPGAYLTEISDETDVTMGTARYHLRILEFENLVVSEEVRGRRRYVPVGTEWTELEAALHDETTARIVETLASDGPDSVSRLADRLDRDPSTISHHLDRLAEDGIVERERDGRAVVNTLADSARIALEDDATAVAGASVPSSAD